MKYTVTTQPHQDGTITQSLYLEGPGWREVITQSIVHTQDEQIKQALIAMGWTPPAINSGASTND